MFNDYNKLKVLRVFFDNPLPEGGGFQLRELSRKIKLAPKSVKIYLKELEKEGLITVKKHRAHGYPLYYANRDSEDFLFCKKINTLLLIKESGLIEYLNDACIPDVIILFGSAAKGEDTTASDLDLFIQCKEKKFELEKYEKFINRNINIFFDEDVNKLSKELRSNIINGVILSGYIDLGG